MEELTFHRQLGGEDMDAWGPAEVKRVTPPGGWQDPEVTRKGD